MAHELRSVSSHAVAAPLAGEVYTFGPVRVDVARHAVWRDGQPLSLAPKTYELLLILLRSGGHVLSRQELLHALWPDTFVEEANLSFQISALRKALGDGAEAWIETIPKVGYRFTPVGQPEDRGDSAPDGVDASQSIAQPSGAEASAPRRGLRPGLLVVVALASLLVGVGVMWLTRPAAPTGAVTRSRTVATAPASNRRTARITTSLGALPGSAPGVAVRPGVG